MMRRLACRPLALGLALAVAGMGARAAERREERGFPLVETYEPTIDAEVQNFDIANDERGLLYVASLGGVLIYDGAGWQMVPVGAGQAAFAIATNLAGQVGIGGVDEIGLLQADERGEPRYVSLLDKLPPAERKFGQVGIVLGTATGFLFLTSSHLYSWDSQRLATVGTFIPERPFAAIYNVAGVPHLWSRDGIFRVTDGKLVPVPGGGVFRGRRVDLMLPAEGGLLVSVRGEGLFLLRNGVAQPFAPEASRWAVAKRVFCGLRLRDGRFALGSVLGGLLLLRSDGEVDQVIDTTAGLGDDLVSGMTEDRDGALWLALNTGLARIEVASRLSVIDRRAGLLGSIYDVTRHQDALWVATAAGLFHAFDPPAAARSEQAPVWSSVPGVPPSAWSLASVGDDLLVGSANGVFRWHGGRLELIAGTDSGTAYQLEPSRWDPDRVWVGLSNGLGAIRRQDDGWRFEGMVAGVSREVRHIVEGEGGVLWCGMEVDGLIGLQSPRPGSPEPAAVVARIATEGSNFVGRIAGRIVALVDGRLLRLDEGEHRLVPDPAFALFAGESGTSFLAEDAYGNLWRNTRPMTVGFREPGGAYRPRLRTLHELPVRGVDVIYPEPDGTVWLGADNGLYRFRGISPSEGSPLPAPLLARVSVNSQTLFRGAGLPQLPASTLAPDPRRLRIELAPLAFRSGLRFVTRIEPIDAEWSAPATDPATELARLPSGRYVFHGRTVGASGEESPETVWAFAVQPRWYQTPWAFVLAGGLALLAVRAYTRLRSRALRQRARALEARVAAQTEELRQRVEELRRAHSELALANTRLETLSLQDELTGIANRRRLQQVLAAEWSRAQRNRSPLAFVLLDLDLFKLLNDTRGHPEGDLCLQAVARFLARSVTRTGDIIARYGGEELAALLPMTDLAGALQVAERLRQGIEDLAIPHESSPFGRVTASFGVAAIVPRPGQRPEELIEAADHALYRAKTAGRNRVCGME